MVENLERTEIENKLKEYPKLIQEMYNKYIDSKKQWKLKKAEYENKYNLIFYELKLKNPDMTQSDLKAQSEMGSYQLQLDMILAEATKDKVLGELNRLRDGQDNLREISYNYRCEVKKFQG